MQATDLRTLIDFNYWASNRLFDAVAKLSPEQYTRPMGNSFSSVHDTVVHIFTAEWVWDARMHGESLAGPPKSAAFADLAAVRAAWASVEARYRALVAGLDDAGIRRVIDYQTMAGAAASSPIVQVIQHLVNHGTYHRGQVTTLLRQLGAEPPKSMDLIQYYRERSG